MKTNPPCKQAITTFLVTASCAGLCGSEAINMKLADFNEKEWLQVRERRFPTAWKFVKEHGGVSNFIPKDTSFEDSV